MNFNSLNVKLGFQKSSEGFSDIVAELNLDVQSMETTEIGEI